MPKRPSSAPVSVGTGSWRNGIHFYGFTEDKAAGAPTPYQTPETSPRGLGLVEPTALGVLSPLQCLSNPALM